MKARYLAAAPLLGIPVVIIVSMSLNNLKLRNTKLGFSKINHPSLSRLIKTESSIGHLVGNGNHCDLFVGELRSYAGNRVDINRFYNQQSHNSPDLLPIKVVFLQGQRIPDSVLDYVQHEYFHDREHSNAWLGSSINSTGQMYVVFYVNVGDTSCGYDIRCF